MFSAREAAGPAPTGTGRRVAVVATVVVAAGALLALYGNKHDFFDLRIYYAAMRWWAGGHDLYDYAQPDRVQGLLYFTYPPFTALVLRPLAALPLTVVVVLFTAAAVVAVAVTTWWLITPVARRHGWPRWYAAAVAVPIVFTLEPIRETLSFGQINMALVTLILADLLFAVPRGSRLAGAGVGLATAVKLFPGIFIVYLLAARRWRAAAVAAGVAAAATLLAWAVIPGESWRFWTDALWATERVGHTSYTANQSLLGLLSRLVAPGAPNRVAWVVLAGGVAIAGLWRAARAARAGDDVAGLALAGLVGALVAPITWAHHVYWFAPALVVLVDEVAGAPVAERRRRRGLIALIISAYAVLLYGVVSFAGFGSWDQPTDAPVEFVMRNAYVLLALVLLVALPMRGGEGYRRYGLGGPLNGDTPLESHPEEGRVICRLPL